MYTIISIFAIIPPKKEVVKIRKTKSDSDSDGGENHTCTRLQTFHFHYFACYSSSDALENEIYIYLYIWSSEVKDVCRCCIYTSANTRRFLTGGSSTHKTSTGVRTGFGRFVKRFLALFRHRTIPDRALCGSRMVAVQIVLFN